MTIPEDIFCPACAYDLRGATSDCCPECGRSLDNLRSTTSRIPWVHRKDLGHLRAYWQTVWMVTVVAGFLGGFDWRSRKSATYKSP